MKLTKALNFDEIISKLEKLGLSASRFADHDFEGEVDWIEESDDEDYKLKYKCFGKKDYIDGLGDCIEVETSGFHEQEDFYCIKHFVYHNVFIKIKGYYSSYEGVYIENNSYKENCIRVYPKQVMKTIYEEKP
ncbi:MAG TPA: hypothetical protein VFV86_08155 [Nitrososphaeraceae archaeon]|nr:hypothetical protein [Nitrososphaeraceae archaeon]